MGSLGFLDRDWVGFLEDQSEAVMDNEVGGLVFFLFGIFCAYWAQTTKRNAWLWFFLGLFFAPIAGLVLLYKNSNDLS
jgi:hypothetical protein